jgi:serine/threonine-protein kinase HipA
MLQLDVHIEGLEAPAGQLVRDEAGTIAFAYTDAYLDNGSAIPLSLSLPLGDAIFGDARSRAFFQNLLPENDQLDQLIEREGFDRDDVAAILYHLGSDCAGAVSCLPAGAAPVKMPGNLHTDYDAVSREELIEAVERLADRRPLQEELRDPSPVAGVRRKLALAYAPGVGFAVPKPELGVPTTHILKVPDRNDPNEALFEACAAELAAACGLDVAVPQLQHFGRYPRF